MEQPAQPEPVAPLTEEEFEDWKVLQEVLEERDREWRAGEEDA